jgi:hypothetical protein
LSIYILLYVGVAGPLLIGGTCSITCLICDTSKKLLVCFYFKISRLSRKKF